MQRVLLRSGAQNPRPPMFPKQAFPPLLVGRQQYHRRRSCVFVLPIHRQKQRRPGTLQACRTRAVIGLCPLFSSPRPHPALVSKLPSVRTRRQRVSLRTRLRVCSYIHKPPRSFYQGVRIVSIRLLGHEAKVMIMPRCIFVRKQTIRQIPAMPNGFW